VIRVTLAGAAPLRQPVASLGPSRYAGLAAVGLVGEMVHLAGGGGLVAAAGPAAVLVAQDDGVPDRGRDVPGDPDVQRQARPGQPGAELPAAQERGQPARTRDQIHRLTSDHLLE